MDNKLRKWILFHGISSIIINKSKKFAEINKIYESTILRSSSSIL